KEKLRLDPESEIATTGVRVSLICPILKECEDADEIEYLVDGSWRPIKAEKERSYSPQCPILVNGKIPADVVDLTLDSSSSEDEEEEEEEDDNGGGPKRKVPRLYKNGLASAC
ncbi:E3 SUMO-protein ligase PIAS4, partial [Ophiophagus hannah]